MQNLKAQLPDILENEPLSKYSTFRIGGPADYLYRIKNSEELAAIIAYCQSRDIPYFVFGGGSNILFLDEGFRGLVLKIESKGLKIKDETTIIADAGVSIASLIQFSVEHGLTGLEPWVGLPGTVGGAVRGNAGCNGLETTDILKNATLLNTENGKIKQTSHGFFEYEYRSSSIKKQPMIVLDATFSLKKRQISAEEQAEIMKNYRQNRIKKQPFGSSTGSFFKNPSPKQPAGMLIDQAGLKGHSHGKAQISDKHANFFLNKGGATSADIVALAHLAQQKVQEKFQIQLEEEVQILGPHGPVHLTDLA